MEVLHLPCKVPFWAFCQDIEHLHCVQNSMVRVTSANVGGINEHVQRICRRTIEKINRILITKERACKQTVEDGLVEQQALYAANGKKARDS